MEQEQEEQNYGFTKKEREKILKEKFNVGYTLAKRCKVLLEDIIDSVINAIKNNVCYNDIEECIRKYWFTKQIEEWKKNNNTDKEPIDNELMEIVREDLKVRMANTMLALEQELKKHKDINQGDIWFYRDKYYNVVLYHAFDRICEVSNFIESFGHVSPPYKPFFMKNPNDNNKLNGVCIDKHGNDENKTKWIMACFRHDCAVPQCKITFQTDGGNKIKNVEIETAKDKNSKSTYTISLNDEGRVAQITKEGGEVNNADCIEEINNLLFKDDIFKVLRERIEDEEENKEEEKKEENKDEEKVNINNKPADTNINNVPKCFGSYRKNGKDVYRCFGVDIC